MPKEYMPCPEACNFAMYSYVPGITIQWVPINGGGTTQLCKSSTNYAGTATGSRCNYKTSPTLGYYTTNFYCACIYPTNSIAAAVWIADSTPAMANTNYRICKFGSSSTDLMGYIKDGYCYTRNKVDLQAGSVILYVGPTASYSQLLQITTI
jgi:hypothetical protein